MRAITRSAGVLALMLSLAACSGEKPSGSMESATEPASASPSSAATPKDNTGTSPSPSPTDSPDTEDDTVSADELAAFVKAFNSRNTEALCSRIAAVESVGRTSDGEADWSNLRFATPRDEDWSTCTQMYATGWRACPGFKIDASTAYVEEQSALPSRGFAVSWESDEPYRALGTILHRVDEQPELGWFWDGQNFECES